jgi:hypothetical protein
MSAFGGGGAMSQSPSTGATVGQEIKKTLDPALMGAATSKLFSASIGDIVLELSHSPALKHHSFADIEWRVLPPVALGQFHVEAARVATLAEVMKLNAKPRSSGDVLTLNATTKPTLSAHPGAFRFV